MVYNPFLPAFDKETRATTRQRIRHSAGIPTYAALIGFFGSLISRKQPHVLLKLLLRLRATGDGRPVHGLVCGEALEPRDEIYYKMLASENWQGRLVQAGYVDNARDWMAACDVVIAPAFDEAFGRVGVEAQSAGVPVIVSSDAGLREVVEHGVSGLVVDPGNFEGWVEQVGSVLNNADLARHLAEAGQRVAAPLTIEHHADQIEAIYAEIPAATVR